MKTSVLCTSCADDEVTRVGSEYQKKIHKQIKAFIQVVRWHLIDGCYKAIKGWFEEIIFQTNNVILIVPDEEFNFLLQWVYVKEDLAY